MEKFDFNKSIHDACGGDFGQPAQLMLGLCIGMIIGQIVSIWAIWNIDTYFTLLYGFITLLILCVVVGIYPPLVFGALVFEGCGYSSVKDKIIAYFIRIYLIISIIIGFIGAHGIDKQDRTGIKPYKHIIERNINLL